MVGICAPRASSDYFWVELERLARLDGTKKGRRSGLISLPRSTLGRAVDI